MNFALLVLTLLVCSLDCEKGVLEVIMYRGTKVTAAAAAEELELTISNAGLSWSLLMFVLMFVMSVSRKGSELYAGSEILSYHFMIHLFVK